MCYTLKTNSLTQRDRTGGPRATSGPRQLVTTPAELVVICLLVTAFRFIMYLFIALKDLEKIVTISCLLIYVQVPHKLLALKLNRKL
jgi:hypothetical protein